MDDELPPATGSDQVEQFGNDLDRLVNRYAQEYDLPVAAIVGVLHFKIHALIKTHLTHERKD
jgi:hypothetical protein